MDMYVNLNFLPHARQTSDSISAERRDVSPAPSDHSLYMSADEEDRRSVTEPVIQTRPEPAKVPAPQVVTQQRSVPLNMSEYRFDPEFVPGTEKLNKPILLPEMYSGESSFDTYLEHFELISEINDWSWEHKRRFFPIKLRKRLGNSMLSCHGL